MKISRFYKLAATVLAATIIMSAMQPVSLVTTANEPDSGEESTASVLFEMDELRDQYTKVYRLDNGNNFAYLSPEPLHYQTEDGWKDIDNTLVLDSGQECYKNQSNHFTVELPKNLSEGSKVSFSSNEHSISFSLVNKITKLNAKVERSDSIGKKSSDVSQTDEQILSSLKSTEDQISYDSLLSDISIHYEVKPSGLKESNRVEK